MIYLLTMENNKFGDKSKIKIEYTLLPDDFLSIDNVEHAVRECFSNGNDMSIVLGEPYKFVLYVDYTPYVFKTKIYIKNDMLYDDSYIVEVTIIPDNKKDIFKIATKLENYDFYDPIKCYIDYGEYVKCKMVFNKIELI